MSDGSESEAFYAHTEFALEATDSIIWAVDTETDETIRLHGPVESLFGVGADGVEDMETAFKNVVHPDDLSVFEETYVEAARGTTDQFKVEFRTNPEHGPVQWIEAHGRIHEKMERQPLIGISTKITERKRQERELEHQYERLEEFARVVSHDLMNPLSVAMGRLEIAQEAQPSEDLESVGRSLERMETLIDELLTLAREGERGTRIESMHLGSLIESCWANVETADATLTIDIDRQVRGDSNRTKQLLENLFRNAVEHGGDGVRVTVGELDDGFYVADDGPGIEPSEREAVFGAGYSTKEQGTGLGLGIVEQVVDGHGWEITVADSEEGGARFEITGLEGDE